MDQSTRRTAYKLRFEEFDGLVVRVRKPSFRGLRKLARVVAILGDDLRGKHLEVESRLDAWELLFGAFTDALIDWNLTDRGKPVPVTRKGVRGQDVDLLLTVTAAWYRQVVLRHERVTPVEPKSTRTPVPSVSAAPSPEEMALLSIPFEVGNSAALEDPYESAEREPVEAAT